MHLLKVKSPDESTGEWDFYDLVETVPGEEAFPLK
jgi:branched-chain amino acid transport system substrate-binding protein